MLKKILFISFCCVLFSGVASAGGGVNASGLNNWWGGCKLNPCGGHKIPNTACIGASAKNNCSSTAINARDWGDEYAILMMAARKINEHCAYFCPTQVEAKNKNKKGTWTEYADAQRSDNDCVWLCKDGNWEQLDEEITNPSEYCEPQILQQSNYDDIGRIGNGANIENSVAMFSFNNYPSCKNGNTELDVILAITKYLPSGHGAYVQQLSVQADRSGWDDMWSWPNVYPAGDAPEVLVCRPGYKPSGDDCVQATRQCELEERFANLCSDWPRDLFKSDIHEFVKKGNCYQYRCKTAGEAFSGIVDKSCSKCVESINKDGINPSDGTCVHCGTGYVFDSDNAAGNYCSVAQSLTKQDMQYGKNQTEEIVKTKKITLDKQCWTKGITDEYAGCVKQQ